MKRRKKGVAFENPELATALGAQIRKIRREKNLTQEDLAFEAGVDRVTISRIENAQLNVTVDLIFTLSVALKVHPKVLFDDKWPENESLNSRV